MAPVLLNSGWLLLWIIAICSLSGEDDRTTIPWHNGIHCTVDNSTPPGSNCGAKGGCLLPEDSVLTKSSCEVQSYRKLKGGSFFWELNCVAYCGMFLPWCLIHVLFPEAWPDQRCWLWPCVCELFAYSNWRSALWKTLQLAAFLLQRRGEMRKFAVNPFKQSFSFRITASPFAFGSLESHTCLFTANILLC